MSRRSVSAQDLQQQLHHAELRAASEGRELHEGAARVLRKLDRATSGDGLHRTYRRTGDHLAMWDLISDGDLARHGYIPADSASITVAGNDPVRRDRILFWSSESEGRELWIGERLKA